MDSNNATILALSLGIPCATLLSIACLLTLRISHRQLLARRIRNPTVPTNSPAPPSPPPVDPYYGILLEQRPPRILAPLPRQPIPLDEYNRTRGKKRIGILSRLIPPSLRQGLLPLPAGARLSSSSPPPLLPRIPHMPLDLPHLASTPITVTEGDTTWAVTYEVTTPPTHDRTRDANPTAPSAPVSRSELWDNVTIPLSAYIPAPGTATSQYRGAPNVRDRPVTTWEPALEPIQNEEPIASGSTLPVPNDSSYWSNVIEQRAPGRRPRLHRRRWGRIDRQLTAEPRPPPELLAPPESRYYEYFHQ